MTKIIAISNIYTGTGKGFKQQFAQYKKPHQIPQFGTVLANAMGAIKP